MVEREDGFCRGICAMVWVEEAERSYAEEQRSVLEHARDSLILAFSSPCFLPLAGARARPASLSSGASASLRSFVVGRQRGGSATLHARLKETFPSLTLLFTALTGTLPACLSGS